MISKDHRNCPSGTRHSTGEFEYTEKEVKMEAPPSALFYLSTPVLEYLPHKESITMELENHPQSDNTIR